MYHMNTTPEGEPNIWVELTATKLAPVTPAKPDYWWRGEFTMLRRNGYNESLMDQFDTICTEGFTIEELWIALAKAA